MLSSDYLFTMTDNISDMYEELNNSIIEDIARRISSMDMLSESTVWQAQRVRESGALYDDIIKKVSSQTGKTQEELRETFKKAGIDSWDNNMKMAGLTNTLNITENAKNVLLAGLNKTDGILHNMTLTTAIDSQQKFIRATDLAYQQIASGAFDYNTVIRRTVKDLARSGIGSIDYASGIKRSMDSTVRTVVLTGINQTVGTMTEIQAREVGANGYEVTAHRRSKRYSSVLARKTILY